MKGRLVPVRPLGSGTDLDGADEDGEGFDRSDVAVEDLRTLVVRLEDEMRSAAAELRYEEAALLRDDIAELRLALVEASDTPTSPGAAGLAVPVPTA